MAASIGVETGRIIRRRITMSLAPSILADSSSSAGRLPKNVFMIIMFHVLMRPGSMSAHIVSINPRPRTRR